MVWLISLVTSPIGRWLAIGLLAAGLMFGLYSAVYRSGRVDLQAEIDRSTLENMRTRERIEDDIAKSSPDDRRRRLREWVSDGQ